MDTPFLSLSDAAHKTGRSLSTIRRIVRTIADSPSHSDRGGISPSAHEAVEWKKKGEIFAWKIREDILMKHLERAPKKGKKSVSESKDGKEGILGILRTELELKNRQIEKQWEVIHALNDRLREGNILMGSLQQRLALPVRSSNEEIPVEVSVAKVSKETSMESSRTTPTKASKAPSTEAARKASKKASRRGLLRWILR